MVGPSDRAAACAMKAAIAGNPMHASFNSCYQQLDDPTDNWGFGGNGTDNFWSEGYFCGNSPNPVIKYDHKDTDGRIYIPVQNWSDYSSDIFRAAPELPPCGQNNNSSRTWVDIYNADSNVRMDGFCALNNNSDLKNIWFLPNTSHGKVYIKLNDRGCNNIYKSNIISWSRNYICGSFPNPVIKYDHKDADGRIYISVQNWSDYSSDLFSAAPELPPCGQNNNSSRTWVDIYNADSNIRMYGFCALNNNIDLKSLWFLPGTPHGNLYIMITDRGCDNIYKSNTIPW